MRILNLFRKLPVFAILLFSLYRPEYAYMTQGIFSSTTTKTGESLLYAGRNSPVSFSIDGIPHVPGKYGVGQSFTQPQTHTSGVVIVRVPAAQAAGVDPGSWVTRTAHYAAVDNGVVTDVFDAHDYGDGTVTPLPKTDLVECDQSVQVGWLFDGDSFMEPEPPAPSVFRFDFTKEYSVAGGANHWPMALRVNKTDLDGAEIDLTGWGQARLQFDGKDMTVTVTQIEESSTYWRFTFAEFVNEFDSRLSCEIEISEPAPVRAVSSAVKTAVKSRRKKK